MFGFLHEEAGETDRIADVTQVRDRAGLERLAIHDGGIELVRAGIGKNRALAGIEVRIVFEDAHGRFRGVETGTTALQNLVTGAQRALEAGPIFFFTLRCHLRAVDRAGAAMDNQSPVLFVSLHRWCGAILLRPREIKCRHGNQRHGQASLGS